MKYKLFTLLFMLMLVFPASAQEYKIGVNDLLEISVLQPDEITRMVTVNPDGQISFPYIGSVRVKGLTVDEAKELIKYNLSNGYMRQPVVLVSLQESRSQKYFVYGEVVEPGAYTLGENTTVLTAISISGGFSKYGSSSKVKLMRPRKTEKGYETIPVNIKAVMNGDAEADMLLMPGDIVVVSEGIF